MSDTQAPLRCDSLDFEGRARATHLEEYEPESLAWHAAVLEAENARLRNALHCISLGSQNSMTSKEALGREARQALHDTEAK